jgi:hypothetical protein
MTYNPQTDGADIKKLYDGYKRLLAAELKDAEFKLKDADWDIVFHVSGYLAGGASSVTGELKVLEAACQAKLADVNDAIKSAATYFSQWKERHAEKTALAKEGTPAPAPTSRYAKLVTGVLAEAEGTQGFTPQDYPVYLGVLPPQVFVTKGAKARHFKDLVSPLHGEYTHRLQWYLCLKKGLFGSKPAGPLFGAVIRYGPLWQHLFDRNDADDPFAHGKDDFRKPEYLNEWLCTNAQIAAECPLVTSYLRARRDKREALMTTTSVGKQTYLKDYIARKMFGTLYANVPSKEKAQLVDQIYATKVLEAKP